MPKRATSFVPAQRPARDRASTSGVRARTTTAASRAVGAERLYRIRRRRSQPSSQEARARRPTIGVVIPCFNAAAHLDAAITSVLEQSYAVSTVLVVDDASTDETVAIAESYRAKGYPVRCLRMAYNVGPATARNAGVAEIREPFVAFLDADDRWERGHCESLLHLLMQHPDTDLAFARTHSTDPSVPDSALPIPAGESMEMLEYLLDDSFIPQSGVLARRSSIVAAGGYTDRLRYSEDYDLWLRMAHGRRFVASGRATCIRTSHPRQASSHVTEMYRGAWNARSRYWNYASDAGAVLADEQYRAICARAYDRDLAQAWRSRSLSILRSVLALAAVVPDGDPIRARWARRAIVLWPLWRLAALSWDALPPSWRRSLNEVRKGRRGHGAAPRPAVEMAPA